MGLKEEVLILAPHLEALGDPLINKITTRAAGKLSAEYFGEDLAEAQEYLAAHELQLLANAGASMGAGGNITSLKSSRQSISFANPGSPASLEYLGTTAYGQMLINLINESAVTIMTVGPV